MADSNADRLGRIVLSLLENRKISEKQLTHAQRVVAKLSTPTPLLRVFIDLKYITDTDIQESVRNTKNVRIGDLLTELGYITEEDLESAITIQKENANSQKLGDILVTNNFIQEQVLVEVLSFQLGLPLIEPSLNDVDMESCAKIPPKMLLAHSILPVKSDDGNPRVAIVDPLDTQVQRIAKRFLGENISFALSQRDILHKTIELLQEKKSKAGNISIDNSSVIGIANSIILGAIRDNASDIHIEPMPDRLQIRFRIDGVLQHYKNYPRDIIPALTSRFKIMCEADIVEKRRHQGGRILFEYDEGELDLRVSFFITVHGEKIVLRLLNKKQELFDLQSIGLLPRMLSRFLEEAVYQPSGVLLVTGPTGSGKTSTVYSCIHTLKSPEVSIVTAEDPVEFVIEGIAQCSINPKIDLTFDETLRHIVRQDPDIIVIGEIRDTFSADVAVQAALTGHKVLSTFHTEDSIGGLIRLLNMDIAPFMVSSTVVSVLAQRLLRKVCPHCAAEVRPTPMQVQRLKTTLDNFQGAQFRKGRGCPQCNQTGYKGRVGVFELLVLDEQVRDAILEQKSSHEIRNISIKHSGMVTLLEDGIVKAAMGQTTIDEVLRCLPIFQPPRPLTELRRLCGV